MKHKILITIIVISFIATIFFFVKPKINGNSSLDTLNEEVIFYKGAGCGCCEVYLKYLQSKSGLEINTEEKTDVLDIKNRYGVPRKLESCHTAIIDGYFVEGHMPIEAIEKLLNERPDILGISLPGMPSGAPGMAGAKQGDFVIYGINKDGSSYE